MGTLSNSYGKQNLSVTVACHCYPLEQCPNHSSTCVSTTGCFHSFTVDSSTGLTHDESFGCLVNDSIQDALHCRRPEFGNKLLFCCYSTDGDYCNRNSGLHRLKDNKLNSFSGYNVTIVTISILLPAVVLIFGLVAIGVLWKCIFVKRLKHMDYFPSNSAFKDQSRSVNRLVHYLHSINQNFPLQSKSFGAPYYSPNGLQRRDVVRLIAPRNPSVQEFVSCTSGSGSGLPFLVPRTIARHVRLVACIGKGRFGEVWQATFQGESVAVKIFSSRDEASWARETEIYNTGLLRHPNLLAYYASDMISRGGCTQLWLITAYHERGSLHDYLSNTTLKVNEGFHLAAAVAAGLSFLHSEINGLHAKPAIAHRDLKSKNVLVMHNHEACIADLGLALLRVHTVPISSGDRNLPHSIVNSSVMSSANTQSVQLYSGFSGPSSLGPPPAGPRVGTKRYMSPELLLTAPIVSPSTVTLNNINSNETCDDPGSSSYLPFEMYQAADVYALALVFWELARCIEGCKAETQTTEGYQIPFFDLVPNDPTFAQMRNVVCADLIANSGDRLPDNIPAINNNFNRKSRPEINERWNSDPYLRRFSQIIRECWYDDWSMRLSALRVRKKLEQLEMSVQQELLQ